MNWERTRVAVVFIFICAGIEHKIQAQCCKDYRQVHHTRIINDHLSCVSIRKLHLSTLAANKLEHSALAWSKMPLCGSIYKPLL